MFRTNTTQPCYVREISRANIQEPCDSGMLSCLGECDGKLYCNDCERIYVSGGNNVEIFANSIDQFTCERGCNATVNAITINTIYCIKQCNLVVNAYTVFSISCHTNCTASMKVQSDMLVSYKDDSSTISAIYHNNFTEFCINTGYGYPPIPTTTEAFTTTFPLTTTEELEETTIYSTTEQAGMLNFVIFFGQFYFKLVKYLSFWNISIL